MISTPKEYQNIYDPTCKSSQQELLSYNMYKIQQACSDPKYKKELCSNFISNGNCKYSYKCRFAHGINDLMLSPSKSKTKPENNEKQLHQLCSSFFNSGFCLQGKNCTFSHRKNSQESSFNMTLRMTQFYKRLDVFKCLTTDGQSTIDNSRENSFVSSTDNTINLKEEERKKSIDSTNQASEKKKSKLSMLFEISNTKTKGKSNDKTKLKKAAQIEFNV